MFRHQLIYNPPSDKFKPDFLIAQLDLKDKECIMKETAIEVLCNYPAEKGAECHANSSECARNANAINYPTFVFPLA